MIEIIKYPLAIFVTGFFLSAGFHGFVLMMDVITKTKRKTPPNPLVHLERRNELLEEQNQTLKEIHDELFRTRTNQ